jgi:hypothetical protein
VRSDTCYHSTGTRIDNYVKFFSLATCFMCFRELQSAETAYTETELESGEEETKLSSDTNLEVEAVCDVKGPEEQEESEKRDVEIVKTGEKEEDKTEKKEMEKTEEEQGARRKRSEGERKIEGECDDKEEEYEDQYEKYDVSTRIRKTKSGKRKKKTVMKERGGSEEICSEKGKKNRMTEGMVERNWKKTEQKKDKNKMTEPRREEFHTSVVNAGIFR